MSLPPVNFQTERNKALTVEGLLPKLYQVFQDIYRKLDGVGSPNVTVVIGGASSGGGGTSTTSEMRVGRASVGAGSVVVTFSSNMSTTDYELVCLMKDNDGVFQTVDTHAAIKSISGFTVDTYAAGTLIYVAIPRQ